MQIILDLFLVCVVFKFSRSSIFPDIRFLFLIIYYIYYHFGFTLVYYLPEYAKLLSTSEFQNAVILDNLFFYIILTFILISLNASKNRIEIDMYAKDLALPSGLGIIYAITVIILIISISSNLTTFLSGNLTEHRQDVILNNKFLGFLNKFLFTLGPYLFLCYKIAGINRKANFLVLLIFFANLLTGQKMPILLTVYLYFLGNAITQGKFQYKMFFSMIVLCLPLLITFVFLSNYSLLQVVNVDTIVISFNAILKRIVLIGPVTVYDYFVTFPFAHDFLINQSSTVPSDQIVYNYRYSTGLFGTINSFTYSLMYAFFGNLYIAAAVTIFITLIYLWSPLAVHYLTKIPNQLTAFRILLCYLAPFYIITDARTAFEFPMLLLISMALYCEICRKDTITMRVRQQPVIFLLFTSPLVLFFLQGQIRGLLNLVM